MRKQNAQVRNDAYQTCLKISLQLFLPNGKIGASGPNARPHVAKDSKPGLVLAMIQSLEATLCVLEIRPRYENVRKQNAQVRKDAHQTCLKISLQLFLPNGKIGASGPNARPHVAKG